MSTITIKQISIPNWNGTTAVELRIALDKGFITSNGIPLQASSQSSGKFYKKVLCSVVSGVLTIPEFTLDSTRDGLDSKTSRYSAAFFNPNGQRLAPFHGFESFQVPELFDTGTTTTWGKIRSFNSAAIAAPVEFSTYSRTEIDRKLFDTFLQLQQVTYVGQAPIEVSGATIRLVQNQAANSFIASPASNVGNFTVRTISVADLPTIPLSKLNLFGLNTDLVAESSRLYFTTDRVRNSISTTPPLIYSPATGNFSIQLAGSLQSGALSSADWNTFNAKENPLSFVSPINRNSNIISINPASALQDGYLKAVDWSTFNSKISSVEVALNGALVGSRKRINFSGSGIGSITDDTVNNEIDIIITGGSGGGSAGVGVRLDGNTISNSDQVLNFTDGSATALNAASSGGVTTITLNKSSSTSDGFLSSADWSTFNNKANAFTVAAPLSLAAGVISIQQASGSQSGFLSNTDWNSFNSKANAFTVAAPLSLAAGVISIQQASGSQSGFLSNADWNSFNNKVSASRTIGTGTGLTGGGDLSANRTLSVVPDSTVQRVEVALNGALVGSRRRINFSGGGIGSITDDTVNNEIDIVIVGGSGGTLTVAGGGTGNSSLTANGVLIGNATDPITAVTGLANQVLRISTGGIPSFGAVDLSSSDAVSGTLPINRGGTGATTRPGAFAALAPAFPSRGTIIVHDGSSWSNLGSGADGQVLTANSSNPAGVEWSSASSSLAATDDLQVTTSGSLSTISRAVSGAGSGYVMIPDIWLTSVSSVTVSPINQVRVYRFYLPAKMTFSSISFRVQTGATGNSSVGIYSSDGILLINSGAVSSATAGVKRTNIVTSTLSPGFYYAAYTSSSASIALLGLPNAPSFTDLLNEAVVQCGIAGNLATNGALPPTLGTVSNISVGLVYIKLQS